jgi:hypothetical protein
MKLFKETRPSTRPSSLLILAARAPRPPRPFEISVFKFLRGREQLARAAGGRRLGMSHE